MTELTLDLSRKIIDQALVFARQKSLNPLAIVVLDARAALVAAATEDGSSGTARWKIAYGKANGAVAVGAGSRKLAAMAIDRPHFLAGVTTIVNDGIVPVPGGVLIRNSGGQVIGAAGASGDTSDNDEAALVHAIKAAGLVADAG